MSQTGPREDLGLTSATPRPQPVLPTQRCWPGLPCLLCLGPEPPGCSHLTADAPQEPAAVGAEGSSHRGPGPGSPRPPGGSIAKPADSKGGWGVGFPLGSNRLRGEQLPGGPVRPPLQPGLGGLAQVLEGWPRSVRPPASCAPGSLPPPSPGHIRFPHKPSFLSPAQRALQSPTNFW